MSESCASIDPRPDAFHATLSRRAGARAVGAARRRRRAGQRLAALAATVAVPAMAAAADWHLVAQPAEAAQPIAPMAFETPGESFPGSAFYYLDDVPYLPLSDAAPEKDEAAMLRPQSGDSPVAHALSLGGTALDRMRAQKCMTMAIYYEAATESDAGQRAVAQVVLNRVAHPSYPDNVCGVVFQGSERSSGCQFSFTCDGSLARQPEKAWWDRASKVARAALAGAVYKPVGLATHYHTLAVHPYWAGSLQSVGTIGAHRFYRWRGAAGQPAAFHESYGGGEPLPAPYPRATFAISSVADPVELARAYEAAYASAQAQAQLQAGPVPAARATATAVARSPVPAPIATPEAAAQAAPAALAGSGAVKPEYARSGQWIEQAGPHR